MFNTVIKSREKYDEYCKILEDMLIKDEEQYEEEIELLTLLIENWDGKNISHSEIKDPVEILKALMEENGLKAKDLTDILGLLKGTISKILNYHKGMSKETIRKLSQHFKLSQDIFNRPSTLVAETETTYHRVVPHKKKQNERFRKEN